MSDNLISSETTERQRREPQTAVDAGGCQFSAAVPMPDVCGTEATQTSARSVIMPTSHSSRTNGMAWRIYSIFGLDLPYLPKRQHRASFLSASASSCIIQGEGGRVVSARSAVLIDYTRCCKPLSRLAELDQACYRHDNA